MTRRTTAIPAVHDWHLEEVLRDLGLLSLLSEGQLRCAVCDSVLTFEIVGGILVRGENQFELVCSRTTCLERSAPMES